MKNLTKLSESRDDTPDKPMSEEDLRDTIDLISRIASSESDGYFMAIEVTEITDDQSVGKGVGKITRCNKSMIIDSFLASMDFEATEVVAYLMARELGKDDLDLEHEED